MPSTWQRSARTLAWSLHACTNVKSLLLLHTKLASSAARTASFDTAHHHRMRAPYLPYLTGELRCFTLGSPLGFVLGSGDYKSSLYIRIRVAVQRRTVAAALSLRVVWRAPPGYGTEGGRERKAEYTQQRYVNRLIRFKFSTVHVMASRAVYRFCL